MKTYRKLKKGTKALIYLLACSLHGKKPDLRMIYRTVNNEKDKLFSLAHRHTVGSMTAISLKQAENFSDTFSRDEIKKWESMQGAAVKRRFLFDTERERLFEIMEKTGIDYCPLKGIILQDLYPIYEMREMSDNDILFDETRRDILKKLMLSEGYTLEDHGVTNHDLYTKEPVYNFEFHTRLFMHTFSTRFTSYYDGIRSKLIKAAGKDHMYLMSDEDFYVYMTAHAYKHFNEGGTGLRSLTDTYIFNLKKGNTLDREYIRNECNKLGISSFEKTMRTVSLKLFSDPDKVFCNLSSLNDRERDFLSYISFTGSYCTKEDFIKSRMKRSGSKGRYILSRLVPDNNYYKEAHPFLYKNKILIPPFLVYRFGKMLLTNRMMASKEIRMLLS